MWHDRRQKVEEHSLGQNACCKPNPVFQDLSMHKTDTDGPSQGAAAEEEGLARHFLICKHQQRQQE